MGITKTRTIKELREAHRELDVQQAQVALQLLAELARLSPPVFNMLVDPLVLEIETLSLINRVYDEAATS